jgi:methionine-S-sulfoxide reductase
VIRTRVGYAGGTTANPTYRSIGDHSETIQIDFDPNQISYEELLAVFWDSHSPTSRPWSQQYASIIFYHDEAQKQLALATLEEQEARYGGKIFTEIVPFSDFTLAEAYHQKYRLQQVPELARAFQTIYPDDIDFVNSTAAARVNGYAGGYGTSESLDAEIDGFGLPPKANKKLRDLVRR